MKNIASFIIMALCLLCTYAKADDKSFSKAQTNLDLRRGDIISADGVEYSVTSFFRTVNGIYGTVVVMGVYDDGRDITIPTHLRIDKDGSYVPSSSVSDLSESVSENVKTNPCYLTVVGINDYAFKERSLKSLRLPSYLKHIGKGAFEKLKLENGYLFVPFVNNIWEYAFDGLEAKLVFIDYPRELKKRDSDNGVVIPTFRKTFDHTELLPEIHIPASHYNNYLTLIPQDSLFVYGLYLEGVYLKEAGMPEYTFPIVMGEDKIKYADGKQDMARSDEYFNILLTTEKKFDTDGDCRDRFAPRLYKVTNKKFGGTDTYSTYNDNGSVVRFQKGEKYYYFSNEGKSLDQSSVLDKNGYDPFGTQIETGRRRRSK